MPRERLVERFRNEADSTWRWYMPPEQQVGRALYQTIIERIKSVPEGPAGSPFPPAAFIADQTATLNKLRVALMESISAGPRDGGAHPPSQPVEGRQQIA